MGESSENKEKKHICTALLAHVDAGKTTLSEGMLYLSGSIRKMGRVDNKDAFLDNYELERARGITIFSKQAQLQMEKINITLLDTPGHIDFSAEMERTLQVLDYAILIISGADGVQGHTLTLWRLLKKYNLPVFLFVNKMDQNGTDKQALLEEMKQHLDEGCIDFTKTDNDEFYENAAVCDEKTLDAFLENGIVEDEEIKRLIRDRKIFPCYFGSALKLEGVEAFMKGIEKYSIIPSYPNQFGAKVFKISRDEQGNRLTHMKITGGSLKVRETITNRQERLEESNMLSDEKRLEKEVLSEKISGEKEAGANESKEKIVVQNIIAPSEIWEEKVKQIRIYSGEKYDTVNEIEAGFVCAVAGLTKTYPGEGLGIESASFQPILEPVLTYQVQLPKGYDAGMMLPNLRQLEEEEPELHVVWNEKLQEIQVQMMGEVQIEILKSLIEDRFGVTVEFGTGNIVYKETIENTVEGVGHFEPLRHYAEVHLLLEPGELGSGLQFSTDCSEDKLDKNWQRLILSHLEEKEHKGVLTGSSITDMKITLIAGRAHLKHTEGGDFRQATYRAVRQGLKQAQSVLLEPYYSFRLEVPEKMVGKAMTDMDRMYGTFEISQTQDGNSILTGCAPVATMRDYQKEVIAYTKGHGRLFCTLKGYEPCHNAEEVILKTGYDSEKDLENPTGSVFCAHGAGFSVSWDQVKDFMHIDSQIGEMKEEEDETLWEPIMQAASIPESIDVEEIDAILEKTFYANQKDKSMRKGIPGKRRKENTSPVTRTWKETEQKEEYLLVDGYNIIFAWENLNELAKDNIDGARTKLMDILCNYQGSKKCNLIVVFDAYRVQGHRVEIMDYHNIHVVYTKEAETADQYIEKFAHENKKKYNITVATSDGLEQIIIRGQGCRLLSAREFKAEVEFEQKRIREEYLEKDIKQGNCLLDSLSEEEKKKMLFCTGEDE